jgi:hypothetical protein
MIRDIDRAKKSRGTSSSPVTEIVASYSSLQKAQDNIDSLFAARYISGAEILKSSGGKVTIVVLPVRGRIQAVRQVLSGKGPQNNLLPKAHP